MKDVALIAFVATMLVASLQHIASFVRRERVLKSMNRAIAAAGNERAPDAF